MENNALTLENVTGKGLGFKLKDISAEFENGYIYAITGKNGAGKTTLFNYILAQRKRYTGSIKMSGYELAGNHAKAMEIIGFVSEDNVFFENRTGKQNADILGLVYDDFDVELFNECMKKMNVSTATTLWRMSRGERMKFQLAFAIAHHSRLYLLDEATAGMDAVFKIELFDMLRELIAQECCVIMTTHDMTEINFSDLNNDMKVVLIGYMFYLLGVTYMVMKYKSYQESYSTNRKRITTKELLKNMPIDRMQLWIFVTKKKIKPCAVMTAIIIAIRIIITLAAYRNIYLSDILMVLVFNLIVPVLIA